MLPNARNPPTQAGHKRQPKLSHHFGEFQVPLSCIWTVVALHIGNVFPNSICALEMNIGYTVRGHIDTPALLNVAHIWVSCWLPSFITKVSVLSLSQFNCFCRFLQHSLCSFVHPSTLSLTLFQDWVSVFTCGCMFLL